MSESYSLEKIMRIYDDKDGSYIEIRPSADAIEDWFDIRNVYNKEETIISFNKTQLPLIISALQEML